MVAQVMVSSFIFEVVFSLLYLIRSISVTYLHGCTVPVHFHEASKLYFDFFFKHVKSLQESLGNAPNSYNCI
jgi:hypothetical protein